MYVAGTANGRARWVDLEKGLLKADVYCRPLGKSAVRALSLHDRRRRRILHASASQQV